MQRSPIGSADQALASPAPLRPRDESQLRYPLERPIFVTSALLNLMLMATAIAIMVYGVESLKAYPFLAKRFDEIRALAIAAVFALPGVSIIRNMNRSLIRGNAIRLSRNQIPEIYAILERQCEKLGMERLPELYVSDTAPASHAFSAWKQDGIVLSTKSLGSLTESADVIAFNLGRQLGALRLGHASWVSDMLLSYVLKIRYLKTPLLKGRTYSCDPVRRVPGAGWTSRNIGSGGGPAPGQEHERRGLPEAGA